MRTANDALHDRNRGNKRMRLESTRRIRRQESSDLDLERRDIGDEEESARLLVHIFELVKVTHVT
jgi:hypothetical protein